LLVAIMRTTHSQDSITDPIAEALSEIERDGDTGEGRLLRRICSAVATGEGQFREEEISLLSRPGRELVYALAEARMTGRYETGEWQQLR